MVRALLCIVRSRGRERWREFTSMMIPGLLCRVSRTAFEWPRAGKANPTYKGKQLLEKSLRVCVRNEGAWVSG